MWSSMFNTKTTENETPIKSPGERMKNLIKNNFRGILGIIPLIVVTLVIFKEKDKRISSIILYMWMFWCLLIHPVAVPVVGFFPIAILPNLCTYTSAQVCVMYFKPGIAFFIIGGWVVLLLNNSGFDRRMAVKIIYGDQLTKSKLVIKCSLAAYLLSMFCSRLLVTSMIMEFVSGPLMNMQSSTKGSRGSGPNYNNIRYILCNAIQTSSSIGSIAFIHTSYTVMASLAIFPDDSFNYINFLAYSLFAVPTSLIMFILNLCYNLALCASSAGEIGDEGMGTMKDSLESAKNNIPKNMTLHEWLSVFFALLLLVMYCTRWNKFFDGWSTFRSVEGKPKVHDVTVAALAAIILHSVPKSFSFLKYFKSGLKRRDLPPAKPESAILFWRFVDKNTCYGYLFLIGGGVALVDASRRYLTNDIHTHTEFVTERSFLLGSLFVCVIVVIMSNIMTGVATLVLIMPIILCLGGGSEWTTNTVYLVLAVGIGSSFGFASPFLYTPAHYSKKVAKISLWKQIKYSLGSILICIMVLWICINYIAPEIISKTTAVSPEAAEGTTTTTTTTESPE